MTKTISQKISDLTILIISDQYDLSDLKYKLEMIGFKKSRIRAAINLSFALQALEAFSDQGKSFDLIIFNYSDICDLKMIESLDEFKNNSLILQTPIIVMVHPSYLEPLSNSSKFKDSGLIFESFAFLEVNENELRRMITEALGFKK